MSKYLFISPHPDDVEIGCGGTIHSYVQEGHECHIAIVVGYGDLTMVHSKKTVSYKERQDEQYEAAKILGIKVNHVHWLEVGVAAHLDLQPIAKLVEKLDWLLVEKYDGMFIPLPSHNQDHNYVWQACLAATRPSKVDRTDIFGYEQPTQFHGEQLGQGIMSRYYVTLTHQDQHMKNMAILCHKSQMVGRQDSLVGTAGTQALAKLRGLEIGEMYAEMFMPLKIVE